ncbi:GNAT family N-acetyltransferase [Marinilactibacillus kalidii]|uniref:GNAT family N-acetyltransferase n=1 Tax=Marinilactibacillus kalidii TaxID=2820274 RepID=UPI001ABE673C|nr:GNAT family N-acetyltransferase [Marinilactibacillus kalidii]
MWQFKQLEEMSAKELHSIVRERTKVFVVEQSAAYQEVDDIDLTATHLIKRCRETINAYCRIYIKDRKIWIGRVLVPEHSRGSGNGKELLKVALNYISVRYPKREVQIQAQAYLKDFYESYGFEIISELYYDEDDIAHYDMLLNARKPVAVEEI